MLWMLHRTSGLPQPFLWTCSALALSGAVSASCSAAAPWLSDLLVLAGVLANGGSALLPHQPSPQSRWPALTKAGVLDAWASVLARGAW